MRCRKLLPALRDLAGASERIGRAVRELAADSRAVRGRLRAQDARARVPHGPDAPAVRWADSPAEARSHRPRAPRVAGGQCRVDSCARCGAGFVEHVNLSTLSATQLSPEQKLFKKNYTAGRRELEHEFGKTMRYKSIRDLAAGETGQVVRDLKPIWLMSPLSVSDTLPLDTQTLRRGDLRRGQPDSRGGGRARALPRAAGDRGGRRDAAAADELLSRRRRRAMTTRSRSKRKASGCRCCWMPTASSRSARAICRPRCSPGTTAAVTNRSSASATPPSTPATSTPFPTGSARPRDQEESAHPRSGRGREPHCRRCSRRPISFHSSARAQSYENRRNAGEAADIAQLVRELLASASHRLQHRHRRLHRGAAGRDREPRWKRSRPRIRTSPRGSRRNTPARRTTSSAASSSRTWRTCRATSATSSS